MLKEIRWLWLRGIFGVNTLLEAELRSRLGGLQEGDATAPWAPHHPHGEYPSPHITSWFCPLPPIPALRTWAQSLARSSPFPSSRQLDAAGHSSPSIVLHVLVPLHLALANAGRLFAVPPAQHPCPPAQEPLLPNRIRLPTRPECASSHHQLTPDTRLHRTRGKTMHRDLVWLQR